MRSLVEAEAEEGRLSHDEVLANIIITMVAGQETTTSLIGNGMVAVLRDPTLMARLIQQPELMAATVEELIRFDTPLSPYRSHLP